MGKRVLLGFKLKWIIIVLFALSYAPTCSKGVSSTSRQLLEVEKRMNYYKKHAVKSIQSEDGDIIDCIDIYKQPAFDHPVLQSHKIQMTPSHEQTKNTVAESNKSTSKEKSSGILTSQIWRRNGSCPNGTIPIRRIREEVLLNNKSNATFPYQFKKPSVNSNSNPITPNRSVSILLTVGYNYNGAKADIKVWNPYVELDDEYSTSRILVQNGAYPYFESIESGWMVNPSVYGDRETRIYVYWTVDGSRTTGCFDLLCPGFVQTSTEVALGGAIQSIPVPGGLPWIMTVYLYKDPETSNWWMQYQENTNIGYWPAEIFEALSRTGESVEWGGEVYSKRLGKPGHTRTEMGSGELADHVEQSSGWTKRMRIRDNSMVLKYPEWVYPYSEDYDCYTNNLYSEYMSDPEFYFGGPGKGWQSWRCTGIN